MSKIKHDKTIVEDPLNGGVGGNYRGYRIQDLVKNSSFNEIAFLFIYGALPSRTDFLDFEKHLVLYQELPVALIDILNKIPGNAHPLDMLRTVYSVLPAIEPTVTNPQQLATKLLAYSLSSLLYWHTLNKHGRQLDTRTGASSLVEHFLLLLHEKAYEKDINALNLLMMLYAEDELTAPIFSARLAAGNGSDFCSCLIAAMSALKGKILANDIEALIMMIKNKDSHQKIMSRFDTVVYKKEDPRFTLLREYFKDFYYYNHIQEPENLNLDFYSAFLLHNLSVPVYMYSSMFFIAKLSSYTAHIIAQQKKPEQVEVSFKYINYPEKDYLHINNR